MATQNSAKLGIARLVVDGVLGLTESVEEMHATITSVTLPFADPKKKRTRGITGLVYAQVRNAAQLVGAAVEQAKLAGPADDAGASSPGGQPSLLQDTLLATVNGVVGDHLEATSNPLAIPMSFRSSGRLLTLDGTLSAGLENPTGKIAVMVGGLCMSDLMWTYQGHNHGLALQADLGYTPVFLRYNTGRHVSTNGRELAARMQELFAAWPVPIEDVVVVAHSLGGLVTRSALHYAAEAGLDWPGRISKIVFLGTPHYGAPLERSGHWVQWIGQANPYTAPIAKLARLRSAAITDLRYGYMLDEDWSGAPDRFGHCAPPVRTPALPPHIRHYAIAATLGSREGAFADVLLGDGMVPLDSALGRHTAPDRSLGFTPERQWVGYGMGHIDLVCRPEAYQALKRMIAE